MLDHEELVFSKKSAFEVPCHQSRWSDFDESIEKDWLPFSAFWFSRFRFRLNRRERIR